MNCSHPVIYAVNGVLKCHICGAVINAQEDKQQEEKPVETPKRKRKAKGADGNENH